MKHKIKVLHIIQGTEGGTLEYLRMFFKYYNREKFEMELICPNYGPMKFELAQLGIKIHDISIKREISIIDDYRAYREIRDYIKVSKPHIVHLHSSKAGVVGRFAAYKNKVPSIYNPHGWAFSMDVSKNKKKFYAFIERICSKITYKIISISDFEKQLAIEYKVCLPEKIKVIYNAIDTHKHNIKYDKSKIIKELGLPQNAFVVGMVARLTEAKSPKTLVNVAKEVINKISNVYFVFVGDGELREDILKLIKEQKLEQRVIITGWTHEVSKFISVFDIGVLTSRWEGFGLSIVEYMASRKPVIASNTGGIKNIIQNNYTGILVPCGDVHGFAEAIIDLNNNKQLSNYLVNNAYNQVIEKFNIDRLIYEHERLYIDVFKTTYNQKGEII